MKWAQNCKCYKNNYRSKIYNVVKSPWKDVKYVSAGSYYTVAISYDGEVVKVLGAGYDE